MDWNKPEPDKLVSILDFSSFGLINTHRIAPIPVEILPGNNITMWLIII
jgi:hypothetical protein